MKRSFFIALTVVSSLTITAMALAHGKGASGENAEARAAARIQRLDSNQDGKVSPTEARDAQVRRFGQLDANHDGVVTAEEARENREKRAATRLEQRFIERDTNKDGRLSKTESKLPEARFAALDSDRDGSLVRAELARGRAKLQNSRNKKAGAFVQLDANGDGKLTRAEAEDGATRVFGRADTNGDGAITKDELKQARKAGRVKHDRANADGKAGAKGHGKPHGKANARSTGHATS